jgi:hypothetical protein
VDTKVVSSNLPPATIRSRQSDGWRLRSSLFRANPIYHQQMLIFISSTFVDLRPEREAAKEALLQSQLVPWGMELFVSQPSEPLSVCLEKVQFSDAVVLLIGFNAGSLIPESPELTYTRAEFELAQKLGRPVFLSLRPMAAFG